MKPRKNRFVYLAGGLLVCLAAQTGRADSKSNPYQAIVERNPFGLKPPPPPPDNTPPPPVVPLAKVVLTGITSMFGPTPRALLEITEQEAGKTGTVRKPILREGDRDGSIEVVSINVEKSLVKIRNAGIETNISFDTPKLTGAGPAPVNNGFGAPSAYPPPIPGAVSPSPTTNAAGRGVALFGNSASAPSAPAPAGVVPRFGAPGTTYTNTGFRSIPSRMIRNDGSVPPPVPR